MAMLTKPCKTDTRAERDTTMQDEPVTQLGLNPALQWAVEITRLIHGERVFIYNQDYKVSFIHLYEPVFTADLINQDQQSSMKMLHGSGS